MKPLIIRAMAAVLLAAFSLVSQPTQWLNFSNTNYIQALYISGDYLWIGTEGGLVRLNMSTGSTAYYNKGNSGLPLNDVTSITEDRQGNIWVGTGGGSSYGVGEGLACFDGATWTQYNSRNSALKGDDVQALVIDSSGYIWAGTNGGGTARFDENDWIVYDTLNSGLPGNRVYVMAVDKTGKIWASTWYNGMAVYENGEWGRAVGSARAIEIDQNGFIWVITSNGGLTRKSGSGWLDYYLPYGELQAVKMSNDGNLWIGTRFQGLVKFDGSDWTVYDTSNSDIGDNNITAVVTDTLGNTWVGTVSKGLVKFNGNAFVRIPLTEPQLPDNGIKSMAVTETGSVWAGTNKGMGIITDFNVISFNHEVLPLKENIILAIAMKGNQKWVGAERALLHFDGMSWEEFNPDNSPLPHFNVNALVIDRSGALWAGTRGGGLFRYDGSDWEVYTKENSGLRDD